MSYYGFSWDDINPLAWCWKSLDTLNRLDHVLIHLIKSSPTGSYNCGKIKPYKFWKTKSITQIYFYLCFMIGGIDFIGIFIFNQTYQTCLSWSFFLDSYFYIQKLGHNTDIANVLQVMLGKHVKTLSRSACGMTHHIPLGKHMCFLPTYIYLRIVVVVVVLN